MEAQPLGHSEFGPSMAVTCKQAYIVVGAHFATVGLEDAAAVYIYSLDRKKGKGIFEQRSSDEDGRKLRKGTQKAKGEGPCLIVSREGIDHAPNRKRHLVSC
jgi:hypothetical protein